MASDVFRDVSPASLIPDERDPVTGRRIPSRDSKDRSNGRATVAKRSPLVVAAVIAAVVLLAGGATALVVSRRNDDSGDQRVTTGSPDPSATIGPGSTSPRASSTSGSTPPAPVFVAYRGGRVEEALNAQSSDQVVQLDCDVDGCDLVATGKTNGRQPADGGHWTATEHLDMGPICISGSTGVAEGNEVADTAYDVRGVGVKVVDGIEVPARIVGTYTSHVPPVGSSCLAESRLVYRFDAKPDQ